MQELKLTVEEDEKKTTMEENRHVELMKFMSSFRSSMKNNMEKMENNIRETNTKLDSRLEEMSGQMKSLNTRIDNKEVSDKEIQEIMEGRMQQLESEMKKSGEQKQKREELKKREALQISADAREKERKRKVMEEKQDREKTEKEKKRYERRQISQEDLQGSEISYKSTWALGIEQELRRNAEMVEKNSEEKLDGTDDYQQQKQVPTDWEELLENKSRKEKVAKVRKPIEAFKNWFADEEKNASSESDSQEENED